MNMFDTEKFIVEIEQRPALYDVSCKEYSNKNIKAKCWVEVCEAMEEDWANLSTELKDSKGKQRLLCFLNRPAYNIQFLIFK